MRASHYQTFFQSLSLLSNGFNYLQASPASLTRNSLSLSSFSLLSYLYKSIASSFSKIFIL
uniref:Uncharacterized protein n=1 Tax=Nelumbo nucifera TaxID=4432 RepID=A0A822Z7Q8_NELNU|nr:TPA_asm: hypothetical protein HUJ06_014963 [Nelumbo nucifera]